MRVYFTNLGCKLNQAELEKLARQFHAAGHRVVERLEDADLHVVNSCTVTHRAARDSRKTARRGGRLRPGMRTVVTGCWATEAGPRAEAMEAVDLVVSNRDKEHLLARVHEAFPDAVPEPRFDPDRVPEGVPATRAAAWVSPERPRTGARATVPERAPEGAPAGERGPAADPAPGAVPVPYVPLAFGNTRALVKVEDGCNVGCAFCIIPSTRGRQRSRPLEEVVDEVRALGEAGVPEVVITGVQISHYAHRRRRLADLVERLLADTSVPQLRLTSIAPWAFDDRLLALWSDPRLCRHVHMSLQSGSDTVLERMGRPYATADYRRLVERLREAIPGLALTTDVITGFPGESEAEHAESVEFVDSIGFARVHVFSYSKRPGTAAAEMPGHLDPSRIRRRTREMIERAADAEERFRRLHLGGRVRVLWEERRDGVLRGLTDNYLRVELEPEAEAEGAAGTAAAPRPGGLGDARVVALSERGVRVVAA